MHPEKILKAGKPPEQSGKALILLHGRGASAENILSLASQLHVGSFTLIAPEAVNNSWYPYSFLSPVAQNEPWLTYALKMTDTIIYDLNSKGISTEKIYLLGFSQGACLALEYAARHPKKYGGVVAFTGGLIGDKIFHEKYKGSLEGTSVFIGSSDIDPHIPLERIHSSAEVLKKLNAKLNLRIYENMGHVINDDEVNAVNQMIFNE